MKILILDTLSSVGVAVAMRMKADGHDVRLWTYKKNTNGNGLVNKVDVWKPHMAWADLIVMTDNSKITEELETYFRQGLPIFGCNRAGGLWEKDRAIGQEILKAAKIDVLPFQQVKTLDDAIRYIAKEDRVFVIKTEGDTEDKTSSFVAKRPEDAISKLQHWKALGSRPKKIMLQDCIDVGAEMAVGGWFGKNGWLSYLNENWEEKRLMAGGCGVQTGEMGTTIRVTKQSMLFEEVLRPATEMLKEIGYVGYVDMNCIIDKKGVPWPLEWTMRMGWPHFLIMDSLRTGDSAQWMADALEGKDTLQMEEKIALGVVMAHGCFPTGLSEPKAINDYPIRGITKEVLEHVSLMSVKGGEAPAISEGKVVQKKALLTADDEDVMVVTGTGDTVQEARDACYSFVDKITWPNDPMYRNDIGERLEEDIAALQKFGYCKDVNYA